MKAVRMVGKRVGLASIRDAERTELDHCMNECTGLGGRRVQYALSRYAKFFETCPFDL